MLIGNTFAWFTDTASTSTNRIQPGVLDVALEMSTDGTTWENAEGRTLSFSKALGGGIEEIIWEPGSTYELPLIRIVNKGNLTLKDKLFISGIEGDVKLNEVSDWTIGSLAA